MSGSEHHRSVAEGNVEAILDAAERLLERHVALSFSALATEAGLSRPTLYGHFPDRERLLAAVVERAVRRWVVASEAIEPDQGPPADVLVRLVDTGWDTISRNAHIAHAAMAELGPDALRHAHEDGVAIVRRLVRRGRKDGSFRTDVPAEWLVSCLFALIHSAREDVDAGRLSEQAARQALARTLPGLFSG